MKNGGRRSSMQTSEIEQLLAKAQKFSLADYFKPSRADWPGLDIVMEQVLYGRAAKARLTLIL